jgi:hypothetical protein
MPFLRLEDILRPTTTPKQSNFLNWFYSYFNIGGAVADRTILNVEPLFYQGGIAGTEFLVYAATKLYINLNTYFSGGVVGNSTRNINLYDETNTISAQLNNSYSNGVGGGISTSCNDIVIENCYFSRILSFNGYAYIKFDGYRITLN